jgi:iron complex outermembrane receptor protein
LLAGAVAALGQPAVAATAATAPGESADLTTLPIEQLLNLEVVTASKIPQKLSDVPASVSVITAEDIRHYGYRTLADILRSVRGVHVTYDRNYSYVGTRGLGRPGDFNTRLLVLIDGRRLNDAAYDQGAAGTEFPLDAELIERVEFVPGPGSAIYGSSAFFGVVNVITRSAASLERGELSLGRFSHGGARGRLTSSLRLGGGAAGLLLSVSGASARGADLYFPEFDDGGADGGVARGLDYDRRKRLFARLDVGGLSLESYFGRRTKGVPTASYGQQFNHPDSRTVDEYAVAALSWQGALSPTLELYAGAGVNRYRYAGNYVYAPGAAINRDVSETRSGSAELRLLCTAIRNHRLVLGGEYVDDSRRRMRNYDMATLETYLDVDAPKHSYGIYLQDDIRLGERFGLNIGVRRDHDAEGGNSDNPRLALLYRATPQVTFKALAGSAFRSANAYERYYETSIEYKRNPNVRSERIRTGELSIEYFPTDRFRASASAFQYRVTDLIALATDPADGALYFSNIDAARSRGVELETEWLGMSGARLKASLSYSDARNEADGAWLSNSPRRLAKLNYSTPWFGDALRTSVEVQGSSRRRTPLGGEVGGYGLVNLTVLSRALGKNVELSASVYNLLDKRYADGPSEEHFDNSDPPRFLTALAQPRRQWQLLLTIGFR